jgi:hypothetical protein
MKKENCSIVTARKSRLAMRQWLLVIYSDRGLIQPIPT